MPLAALPVGLFRIEFPRSTMLKIRSLEKTFPGGVEALRGVSLELAPGEILAVIGPSGAGKSTLLRCVNRLVTPTAGEIDFDGQAMHALRGRRLRLARREIGMIFQSFALVDRLSVHRNILCGSLGRTNWARSMAARFRREDVEAAAALAERVGLGDMLMRRADSLSGGQRQRVGIARALLQRPKLLLVDEPTASLDPRTSRQIMRLLVDLAREERIGVLLNIHDVPLAKQFAGRVVGLSDGRVVFEGAPGELDAAILTEIYGEEDWESAGSAAAAG